MANIFKEELVEICVFDEVKGVVLSMHASTLSAERSLERHASLFDVKAKKHNLKIIKGVYKLVREETL